MKQLFLWFLGLGALEAMGAPGELLLLTVDKQRLQAILSTLPSGTDQGTHLSSFRIAIGKEQGDKRRRGDNRTPEGIYLAEKAIPTSQLHPTKYGPWSVPLNFPNLMDQAHGKTGYGIWLHGAGDDKRIADAQVTEGCVAFFNSDIAELAKWLVPQSSLIAIAENSTDINQAIHRGEVFKATQSWIQSWQARNHDQYMAMYASDFRGQGQNYNSYKRYKKRVFRSYKSIQLSMERLRIITHPKYAVSIMNQDFSGDNRYSSQGRKILYWQPRIHENIKKWQIIREQFEEKQNFEPLNFEDESLKSLQAVASSHGLMKETPIAISTHTSGDAS